MFDIDTIRLLVEQDSRPWSRLADVTSDDVFEIYVDDRGKADQLSNTLKDLGLDVAVGEVVALSATSPDFWVIVGRLKDVIGIASGSITIFGFLKTERGKRLRALLSETRGRKELHPAFSFDALVAWCDRNLGSRRPDESPAWRFDPEAIKARRLPDGLVALEVYEEISGKVLCLVSDGETVTWLSDRVQTGPTE